QKFPFPVIKVNSAEVPRLEPQLFIDGNISDEGKLFLEVRFLYRSESGKGVLCVPESGVVQGHFRRNREKELHMLDRFSMFGFSGSGGELVLEDLESVGVFFTAFLPQLLSEKNAPVLGPGLLQSVDGKFATAAAIECEFSGVSDNSFMLHGRLFAGDMLLEWKECFAAAASYRKFLCGSRGRIVEIPEKLGMFLRSSGVMFNTIDPENMNFELPFVNVETYRQICRELPGALPEEVNCGNIAVSNMFAGKGTEFFGELRAYQQQGVEFMRYLIDRNFNCLLADEMGLGKTVQLLALLSSRMDKKSLPALIVCPASLVANWERECRRFVPDFRIGVPGAANRKQFWENCRDLDLIVISYTVARLDLEQLKKCKFSFLVLDEAQHIKNPGSSNAKCCKSLRAAHRIVLTGTPLENCSADLWSIFDFIHPGMLGTLSEFNRRYADVVFNEELREELRMRISPFILRRTKRDVAEDLPERSEHVVYCDFSPTQKKLYDTILEEGRRELELVKTDEAGAGAVIFSILLRLRQVCCHPGLLPDKRGEGVPSVKTELFMELVQQNIDSGHKMLAFSQFTSLLGLLKPELENVQIPFEYLDGATIDRQKHVDKFNNTPEIPLFLLSLKAGGTGLNLVSADTVLIYDPWWNPAAELQAADRVHRIGQKRAVNIAKLVVRNSIEEKIIALQGRKKAIFDALITADGKDEKLSAAELRSLIYEE
ncbi:MAG: DEAD/DEAH box helicase, partial [Lentisphaeria bacterium]|nr:DEAD/DEAH box helicase [Lentisphaeria bacterium]